MENIRERKLKTPITTSSSSVSNRLNPMREANQQNQFGLYVLISAVAAFIIVSIYLLLPSTNINTIFFKYGLLSDPSWKQNDLLAKNIEQIDVKLRGPEAIAIGPNRSVYTGLRNGVVIRIDEDKNVEKIVQIGDEMDERICDFVRVGHVAEPKCGRPFGMRFKPNTNYLYVADSFYGIVKVDVLKKTKSLILNANDTRFGSKPLRSTEDIDIDGDNIYFVDSSYKHDVNEMIQDITHAFPGGRLFRYNEPQDKLELLVESLYYPNGVQLIPSGDALFVSEFSMARIIKYYLNGPKKGKIEVFAELPGLSEAIRLSDRDTLLVPFVAVFPVSPSFMGYLGRFLLFRPFVGLFLDPNQVMKMWPKYGLIAEYDMGGRLIRTWQDPTGSHVSHVTNAVVYGDKLLLGSFNNDFITVVNYK